MINMNMAECAVCRKAFYKSRKDKECCGANCANKWSKVKSGKIKSINIIETGDKRCAKCNVIKPVSQFFKRNKGTWAFCIRCVNNLKQDEYRKVIEEEEMSFYSEVEKFVYKIKDQRWFASDDDILTLLNLSTEVISVQKTDLEFDEMFYELARWYNDEKQRIIKKL